MRKVNIYQTSCVQIQKKKKKDKRLCQYSFYDDEDISLSFLAKNFLPNMASGCDAGSVS